MYNGFVPFEPTFIGNNNNNSTSKIKNGNNTRHLSLHPFPRSQLIRILLYGFNWTTHLLGSTPLDHTYIDVHLF